MNILIAGVLLVLVLSIGLAAILALQNLDELAERRQLRMHARLEAAAMQKVLDLEARRDICKAELRQVTRRTVRQMRRFLREQ